MTISDALFSSSCKENGLCRNPNCESAVVHYKDEHYNGWFITFGHAGFNTPANNAGGYVSKAKALAAMNRCLKG